MAQEQCPHFQEVQYHDQPEQRTQEYQILKCAFPKPEKLKLPDNGGAMNGRRYTPPRSLQVYDAAEKGENMEYPVKGKCATPEDVVLVTRHCFENFCSGNQGKCPRFLKTTDSSPNRD